MVNGVKGEKAGLRKFGMGEGAEWGLGDTGVTKEHLWLSRKAKRFDSVREVDMVLLGCSASAVYLWNLPTVVLNQKN